MKKIYIIVIALLAIVAVSCGGSAIDSAMSRVEKALERVEKNKADMTAADWQALQTELDEPLKVLASALKNDEVGMLKRAELMILTGRVAAVFMEAGMNTTLKEMENAGVSMDDLERAAGQLKKATDTFAVTQAADTVVNSSVENE